jgi:hypothetical protein
MRTVPGPRRQTYVALLALAAFSLIYYILETDFSAPIKFAFSAIILMLSARGVTAITGIPSEWGIILLRTKKGIEFVKRLARKEEFWKLFADCGTFLAFGIMGYFVVRRPPIERLKLMAVSLILLSFLIFFVSPFVLPFLSISLGLNIGIESGGVTKTTDTLGPLLITMAVYFGGLSTMVTLSIISYGFTVLWAVASSLLFGVDELANTSPGVTLLLPGVNLPLVEGILALLIILVVHEGAHAILAVIGRVPLLSSGLALFGVVPMGAFVEPDEKRLAAKPAEIQTRVIVAGSASNLITSIIFFIILFSFLFITDPLKEKGWLVVEGMENDTIIYSVNGISVEGAEAGGLELKPNSLATLQTSKGTIEREVDSKGQIGIRYLPLSYPPLARYDFFPLDFLFRLLALTFCLNFIIGMVNLLPLPFFDGYRLVELNISRRWVPKAIMYVCIIAFLMNFLPWFF